MSFSIACVKEHLLTNGYVVTFRRHRRKALPPYWANEGRGKPKICDISITELGYIEGEKLLIPYFKYSGFGSFGQWVKTINHLNPKLKGEIKGYLYYVCRIPERKTDLKFPYV